MSERKKNNSQTSTPNQSEKKGSRSRSRSRDRKRDGYIEKKIVPSKEKTMEIFIENKRESEIESFELIEEFVIPLAFQRELPNDLILHEKTQEVEIENGLEEYKTELKFSQDRPKINLNYGDNRLLIDEKNKITQFRDIWDQRIKYLISDYELIDIFRPPGKAKYNKSIIKYMNYQNARANHLSVKNELSEVFSRAYFKLSEVLNISEVLNEYKGIII